MEKIKAQKKEAHVYGDLEDNRVTIEQIKDMQMPCHCGAPKQMGLWWVCERCGNREAVL